MFKILKAIHANTAKARGRSALSVLALLAIATPFSAQAAAYEFLWTGSNGYTLEGAILIPDRLATSDYINERQVECFWIKVYRNDEPLGRWGLGERTEDTTWTLNFEPKNLRFRTGGSSHTAYGQEWNMNGAGYDCGKTGVGFNVGGYAQDVCVKNRLITSSQVKPATPLSAVRNDKVKFEGSDCAINFFS